MCSTFSRRRFFKRSFAIAAQILLPGGMMRSAEEAAVVPFLPSDLAEFDRLSKPIQVLIQRASELTRRNLAYRYGSDDPQNGGMDCSGTICHTLGLVGIEAPRSSKDQYLWVKKKGTLHSIAKPPESLADQVFQALKPGDLLFWEGTYDTGDDDLPVSHVMIYLGTLKADQKPVLFGASSGRRFRGKSIHGVSAFDFHLPRAGSTSRLVGYSPIPGLSDR
ncbi:MAG: C40 family peptidase [Verrucomicrobiae bacterium]|nr:C40 family peptidase [Verrucomicrobiae bacterium]